MTTADPPPMIVPSTVLIVEDTPANLSVVVETLEERGLRVLVAQDGPEGLERAQLVQPDLILLDVMMPGMDGFELCRRLKESARTRGIPVIFMTSLTAPEDLLRGFAVGGVDYVTKPLRVEEVSARINAHLGLRAMQQALQVQNIRLQQEIAEKQRVENELRAIKDNLEQQVAQRAAEVIETNCKLRAEIDERKRAEKEVRRLHAQLEKRVAQRTAQLTASNKELESFTYSVSHDLRAPLRAISGFTRLLAQRSDLPDASARQTLEKIVTAAHRMDGLIQDLLNYARTGQQTVLAVPVLLEPVVQNAANTFQTRLSEGEIDFEIVRPLATPLGDPMLLEQILCNLLDNALTYRTRERRARVSVASTRVDDHVVLSVSDNGIGIAREYHEKIFQVFQRLHRDSEYVGTGIGLAIVAKATRLMNGEVSVESQLGQGSTFRVRLPAAPVAPMAMPESSGSM